MGKTYLYGLVGRQVKIGDRMFFGYKSYPTKQQADDEAEKAREHGRLARVIPPKPGIKNGRFTLLIQSGLISHALKPKKERR